MTDQNKSQEPAVSESSVLPDKPTSAGWRVFGAAIACVSAAFYFYWRSKGSSGIDLARCDLGCLGMSAASIVLSVYGTFSIIHRFLTRTRKYYPAGAVHLVSYGAIIILALFLCRKTWMIFFA